MNDGDATLIDIAPPQLLLRSVQTEQEFPVSGEMTVGRSKDSDIHLDDVSISRQHAKITAIAGAVIIEDLNSTNGTSVNGKKISAPQQLDVGDELRFHKHAFRVAKLVEEEASMLDSLHVASAASDPQPDYEPDEKTALSVRAPLPADKDAGDPAVEEALQLGPDRTQTMSPQKLRLLAQRAALAKSPITTGSGARLVILTAPLRGKVFSLPESLSPGTQVNIGRGGHSNKLNIMLDDKTVSQDHAKLELTPQGWTVITSNARNAITVNGEQATRFVLQHQDTLTIGRIELAFLTDEQDSASAVDASNRALPAAKKSKGRRLARIIVFLTLLAATVLAAWLALPIIQ